MRFPNQTIIKHNYTLSILITLSEYLELSRFQFFSEFGEIAEWWRFSQIRTTHDIT